MKSPVRIEPVALAAFMLIAPGIAAAGVPQVLSEDGFLTDATGNPVDETVAMTFSLYDSQSSVVALWTESQMVAVSQGYFAVQLGKSQTLPSSAFSEPLFLGLAVGNDAEMSPREALSSVPYALKSATAGDVTGDIHPSSVTVNGQTVINSSGEWVGPSSGIQGPAGPSGPSGPPGPTGPAGSGGGSGGSTPAWVASSSSVLIQPASDGHIFAFSFTSAVAGSALVSATFQVIANVQSSSDCEFELDLGTSPSTAINPGVPGFMRVTIPANLPTQSGGGGYLGFNQATQALLPVVAGQNTIYLNGIQTKTCNYYGFAFPTISAMLIQPGTATISP